MNVLVTGASAGIGEASARAFAKTGARVLLVARREDRLQALARELPGAEALVLDVTDRRAVERALEGREVDVLVNSAGLAAGLEPAQAANRDDWAKMIDVNVDGVLNVTHAVLPGMVARNRGHVINLGSVAGTYPYPAGNVYGATKAFLHQFSLNLKADLLGTAVRVTCIEPGMVETEFSVVRFRGDEAKARAVYQGMQPLTAADIAETILWCASRPPHVNINVLEIMPVAQAFGPFAVKRT